MNFGLLFFQFLPLLLYIAVDYWKGFKAGIIAAICAAVVLLVFNYANTGDIDQFSLGECALILFMGVLSLKMNNEKFFKFQPTVLAAVLCSVFLYFEMKGTPLLVRYIPHIEKLLTTPNMSPEVKGLIDQMHTPQYLKVMARLSKAMVLVIGGHGLLMAYAALRLSTPKWFLLRLTIYPALFVATIFVGATTLAS